MSTPMLVRTDTSDLKVFGAVFLRQCYDVPCPVPVSLVLDLGAYTGLSTRWFTDHYDATVIGVEPNPESATMAEHNAPDAEIIRAAIGGTFGTTKVYSSDRGEWATHTRASGREAIATVPVTTVDGILAGRTAQIVKMDVEGAERDVFEHECRWLRTVSLLFLETHDRFLPGCKRAARDAVEATGRTYTWTTRNGSSCDHIIVFP